jgi:NADPH:quinone reductase-like Zn-dependent oxidoreductase
VRAVVHDRYGPPDVLRLEEVERPVAADGEVLVRVHAAAVTRTDSGYRAAHPFFARAFTGLRRPKRRILGSEFAGEVEAVGAAVTRFAVGDRVFGSSGFGAHAEFVRVRESARVAHLPAGMGFAEAAAICEGALYALTTLRSASLREGQRILVYGASGAIGTAAVQLARNFGAHVTAVCSTRNVEVVRSLGPDRVIDYTAEDFTRNGGTYHVIHDAVGKHSFLRCRHSLKPGGVYVTNDLGFLWQVPLLVVLTSWIGDKKVQLPLGPPTTRQDVLLLKELIEAGKYRAVVDRCYPLEQVVEAARYVDTARKTGNVVLTIGGEPRKRAEVSREGDLAVLSI